MQSVRGCDRNILNLIGFADGWRGIFKHAESDLEQRSAAASEEDIPNPQQRIVVLHRREE